jgi:hypothetical protein
MGSLRMRAMRKPRKSSHSGRRGDPVSLHPLKVDDAVRAIFQIKPSDVKRIVRTRPGRKKSK